MVKIKMMKILVKCVLLLFVALLSGFFWVSTNNDEGRLPLPLSWNTNTLTKSESKELETLLNQPFRYLDEGGQSDVYLSQDERAVLKLFKFDKLQLTKWIENLPDGPFLTGFRDRHIAKRTKKMRDLFEGHKLAYDHLSYECALLYMQLKPSNTTHLVTLVDKKGMTNTIDLGEHVFVLQEKGEMLSHVLTELLSKSNVNTTCLMIDQVLALYRTEYSKGIYDVDHGVMHNIGFVGGRPFHLDVGRFVEDKSFKNQAVYQKDLLKVAGKIDRWVKKHYPEHYLEVAEHINNQIRTYQQ